LIYSPFTLKQKYMVNFLFETKTNIERTMIKRYLLKKKLLASPNLKILKHRLKLNIISSVDLYQILELELLKRKYCKTKLYSIKCFNYRKNKEVFKPTFSTTKTIVIKHNAVLIVAACFFFYFYFLHFVSYLPML